MTIYFIVIEMSFATHSTAIGYGQRNFPVRGAN